MGRKAVVNYVVVWSKCENDSVSGTMLSWRMEATIRVMLVTRSGDSWRRWRCAAKMPSNEKCGIREVFNGLRYVVRSRVQWRMVLHDVSPWTAIYRQTRNHGVLPGRMHRCEPERLQLRAI
jgi:transposase